MSEIKKQNNTSINLGWTFYDDSAKYPEIDDLTNRSKGIPEQVFSDIKTILEILKKEKLLTPGYFVLDKKYYVSDDGIEAFLIELKNVAATKPEVLSIDKIGGFGEIVLSDSETLIIEELVTIEDIRFCDRQFSINTSQSYWLPISMNMELNHNWQPIISELNAPRLKSALKSINNQFKIDVEPEPDEIDKEALIWRHQFELFVSPEVLNDFSNDSDVQPEQIEKYIIN